MPLGDKQRLLTYAPIIARCSTEASLYGKCVSIKSDKVQHQECAKEFKQLIECFNKQLKLTKTR